MNKQEIIENMKNRVPNGTKINAERYMDALLDTITEALSNGEKVAFHGFGTFEVVKRKPHIGRNLKTGETCKIPEFKYPKFKAGKPLKDIVKSRR